MSPPLKTVWPLLLVLIASTAFGELSETPRQMEPRRPDSVDKVGPVYTHVWKGKSVTHTGWFLNGKASVETFWFNDHHKMSGQEIARFMKPYDWMHHDREWIQGEAANYLCLSYRGEVLAVIMYQSSDNSLSVWLRAVFDSVFMPSDTTTQRTAETRPRLRERSPWQVEQQTEKQKNDCMIVATENLHRLAPNAAWSNIVMFNIIVNGTPMKLGHAVAVWKITGDGNVFAADDSGTYELETTSTYVLDVLRSLGTKYSAASGESVFLDGHYAIKQ
jgi:hypothetical protein